MKLLLAAVLLGMTLIGLAGAATGAEVGGLGGSTGIERAPLQPLFLWVPAGGFPDHFPYGWCTWWAAYNHPVSWSGNAGDWLKNASAQGAHTQSTPSVGAIAVFRPGSGYSALGHVAIVIAVSPRAYVISEMNWAGFGEVNTRTIGWPDRHVEGFIPVQEGAQ
jgi:CHAP domain